ncbi:MAG: glucose 1-dehydrogenase [Candidatus Binatia bacterium]
MTSLFDEFKLTGKVAIVTGAGKGIGAGIAVAFAEAGADLALSARTKSDLDEVAARVRALGRRALVYPLDVMQLDRLAGLVDATVAEFGGVDLLINNAGGSNAKPFLQSTVEEFEWCFRFNVSTAFEMTKLAVPYMLRRGQGTIVNVTSVAGHKSARGSVTYATAKAALSHFTRNVAADLAPKIRVNAVAPGAVETPALSRWLERFGEVRQQMIDRTAMRRNGRVEDIAMACLYLASPASAWVTGKILEVDGMAQQELVDKHIPDL